MNDEIFYMAVGAHRRLQYIFFTMTTSSIKIILFTPLLPAWSVTQFSLNEWRKELNYPFNSGATRAAEDSCGGAISKSTRDKYT